MLQAPPLTYIVGWKLVNEEKWPSKYKNNFKKDTQSEQQNKTIKKMKLQISYCANDLKQGNFASQKNQTRVCWKLRAWGVQ
jgi:hypothetical protein